MTVRQGSNIIYQTTVPPGPFTLQDVYPSGYGSDLEVSVKEADGSVEVFSVPYASVAQLLRPGMTATRSPPVKSTIVRCVINRCSTREPGSMV